MVVEHTSTRRRKKREAHSRASVYRSLRIESDELEGGGTRLSVLLPHQTLRPTSLLGTHTLSRPVSKDPSAPAEKGLGRIYTGNNMYTLKPSLYSYSLEGGMLHLWQVANLSLFLPAQVRYVPSWISNGPVVGLSKSGPSIVRTSHPLIGLYSNHYLYTVYTKYNSNGAE